MITVTLACLMAFFFSSLKKTRTISFSCPLWVCFSGPVWDMGSCAEQQICFSQTQLALGAKKIIPLFTGWATASVLLLLSGCSTILDRKTSCHTAISRKRRLWILSAYGASYFKNSALTLCCIFFKKDYLLKKQFFNTYHIASVFIHRPFSSCNNSIVKCY